MHMLGDLTGRTLLVFPRPHGAPPRGAAAATPAGAGDDFAEMEQSAIKEAGNILSSAYMNALSDFMGMMLLPSPPSLAVDMSSAVLTTAYLQFGSDKDYVFCVESEFLMDDLDEHLRGFFLLLPDPASLQAILQAPFASPSRPDALVSTLLTSERDRDVLRSFARRIDPSDAGAHNNLGVLYYNKGLYEEAVAAFMNALELDPKMQVAQRNLEIAYFNTGYYDTRIPELKERLRLRPEDRDARWELGRTLRAARPAARGGRAVPRAAAVHPERRRRAAAARRSPRSRAATSSARRAVSSARSRSIPTSSLLHVYARRGAVPPRPERRSAGARSSARSSSIPRITTRCT